MARIRVYNKTTSLGSKGVAQSNLAVEAVFFENIQHAAAAPAEKAKEASLVVKAPIRKATFSVTGKKAAEPTKFGLKHELATKLITAVCVQKSSAKDGSDPLLNAAGAGNFLWKTVSAEEIEVIFGTEPGEGEEFFVSIAA